MGSKIPENLDNVIKNMEVSDYVWGYSVERLSGVYPDELTVYRFSGGNYRGPIDYGQ